MSTILQAALAYAAHGWPVLPLNGKVPALPDWPNAASTDFALIRSWWTSRPHANVGIATGPRSGLAVIDIDPRSGGTDSLGALEAQVGVLPGTVMSLTGGGGLHMLYAHPGQKVTSSAHQLGPGLDVKADGGQIVAPPSVHPDTGRTYAWHGGPDTWRSGLTPWPGPQLPTKPTREPAPVRRPTDPITPETFMRPLVHDQGAGHPVRRLEALVQVVMDANEGERNRRLFWASCRCAEMIAAGQIDESVAVDAMRLAGEAVGLGHTEVVATLRSAFLRQAAA